MSLKSPIFPCDLDRALIFTFDGALMVVSSAFVFCSQQLAVFALSTVTSEDIEIQYSTPQKLLQAAYDPSMLW
jgi:hypothetical protein